MRSILSLFKKQKSKADDGIRYLHLDETDSTNRYCLSDLSAQHPELSEARLVVVTADFQTAGRGCGTNRWESARGQNLLFSLYFHPAWLPVMRQFIISECVALAIRDALAALVADDVTIKWPNDIYVGDRKICGILIENHLAGRQIKDCVIGVGINVNQQQFESDAPNPVSLYQLLGHDTDREALLRDVVRRFDEFVQLAKSAQYGSLSAAYTESLYRRRGFHAYRDGQGDFEGALVEVEDDGHLILRTRDGEIRSYAFKEVEFIINEEETKGR